MPPVRWQSVCANLNRTSVIKKPAFILKKSAFCLKGQCLKWPPIMPLNCSCEDQSALVISRTVSVFLNYKRFMDKF